MSWNRMGDGWTELKGQAKRQLQKHQNVSPDLIGEKQINHESDTQETFKIIKTRAERQLSELHDLLRNMESYRSVSSNTPHK